MKALFSLALFTTLVFVSITAVRAADATNAPAGMPQPMLDNDDMAHLQKVRAQVLAANQDIRAEEERLKSLHESMQTQKPSPEQQNAMFTEWKAYQKTMRAAMLKIDPTLGPIFAKLDSARKNGAPTPFQPAPAKPSPQ